MTPGERVTAIKSIGDALGGTDWSELQLTLNEFGIIPIEEEFSGQKWDYVLAVLQGEPDDKIVALLQFVHGAATAAQVPTVEIRKLPWATSRFRLFASHKAEDKVLVSEIKQKLAWFAVDVFVAHEDIEPSKEWIEEIDLALDTCDALAAFLTPVYHSSDWCDQEVGFAMRRRVLIVPVCLGVMPYGFMNRYQGLKALKLSSADIAENVFGILMTNDLTAARMSEAVVNFTAEANSFNEAIQGSKLLASVTRWTPELLRKVEESIESNSQVSGAFRAPERIRAIVARHRS